jgi:hypothetical protein
MDDRALFLAGHDTHIATVAGVLDFSWIIDGLCPHRASAQ